MGASDQLSKNRLKRGFSVLCLAVVLACPSRPAHATTIVYDPWTYILQFGQYILDTLTEAAMAATAISTQIIAVEMGNLGLTVSGGLSKVENSIAMQTQAQILMAKNIDQVLWSSAAQNEEARLAAQYTVSPNSIVCSTTMAAQMREASGAAAAALQDSLESYEASKDTGAHADSFGPGAAAEDLKDLCDLGFLGNSPDKGRYGNLTATLKCKPPKTDQYLNADLKLSSVLDKHQYLLPAQQPTPTKDGHLLFANTVDSTEKPPGIGTELDWVAAYKYCEHLTTLLPTPTHPTGAATTLDITDAKADRDDFAIRSAASQACLKALTYRTAVSITAANQLGASVGIPGGDPHAIQAAACDFLTTPPSKGMGLSFAAPDQSGGTVHGGEPELANALADCHQYGLSPMMYDLMVAKKCHDMDYVVAMNTRLADPAAVERARAFECPRAEANLEAHLSMEREELEGAIKTLLDLRGVGTDPNRLARVRQ